MQLRVTSYKVIFITRKLLILLSNEQEMMTRDTFYICIHFASIEFRIGVEDSIGSKNKNHISGMIFKDRLILNT